ncbi:MAG TPA: FGGY-family carbohydrate kinase, partial [Bacilli bacterium]|nr:FGGY-family carbohydrate kinase [Bacilli bacterium]
LLLQFQSDILRIEVIRPQVIESTALGAAYLAGLNVGVWDSFSDICQKHNIDKIFTPKMDQHESAKLLNNYKKAVACTKMFKID